MVIGFAIIPPVPISCMLEIEKASINDFPKSLSCLPSPRCGQVAMVRSEGV